VADVKVTVVDTSVVVALQDTESTICIGSSGPQGPRGSMVLSGAGNPSPVIGLIGDQYINTDNGYLFGPKSASGWGAGVPLGNNDPNDLGQVYNQVSASTVWNIAHTLGFTPNVIIVDTAGNVVEPAIEYLSATQIRATFSEPTAGQAYVS
jgi:hypothetical protein